MYGLINLSRCERCGRYTGRWWFDSFLEQGVPIKPHRCNGVDITPLIHIKMYHGGRKLKIKGNPKWLG